MSDWKVFTLAEIPGVSEAADTIDSGASALTSGLDVAAGLVRALSALVQLLADAEELVVNTLVAIMQGILNALYDLLQSGVYFYMDEGPLFFGGNPDGLLGWTTRFEASFNDLGDAARPQFSDDSAVSAVMILVGANDLPTFKNLLALLAQLLDMPKLDLSERKLSVIYPEEIAQGMSTPPDWRSQKLGDTIPPLAGLLEKLTQAIEMIRINDGFSSMLSELADAIELKADTLAALADEIREIVDAILALIESSGIYILSSSSTDGIPGLIKAVKDSGEQPEWNMESWVAGCCLLGGSADIGPVMELFG